MQSQHQNQCDNWGANRADEGYIDVGCVIGHAECKGTACCDYYHACKMDRPITARMF
jgi:hypothetical protein